MRVRPAQQTGVVLIVVLWIIALLTVLLAAFTLNLKVERQVAADAGHTVQLHAATEAVLEYLSALNAVGAEEWPEMPGEVFELELNRYAVRFRLLPETAYVSVNGARAETLERLFAAMELPDPAAVAQTVVERREEGTDSQTGEPIPAQPWRSVLHLARELSLTIDQLEPFAHWFTFYSTHEDPALAFTSPDVLDALGLEAVDDEEGAVVPMDAVFRLQVELLGGSSRRKIEVVTEFSGGAGGYRVLHWNEYNAKFTLDD